jgi:hypothetical protein
LLTVRVPAAPMEMKITVPSYRLSLMRLLLGFGIFFEAPSGISVSRFLEQALGADAGYIENRVQTLFMDGHAVDNPESRHIQNSCTLAVSAAMPGVFGAAFRKQGAYSGLRLNSGKNREEEKDAAASGTPVGVKVKCFNQVAADLGDELLARGVSMDIKDVQQFWNRQAQVLEKDCQAVCINQIAAAASQVPQELAGKTGQVRIQVQADPLQGTEKA